MNTTARAAAIALCALFGVAPSAASPARDPGATREPDGVEIVVGFQRSAPTSARTVLARRTGGTIAGWIEELDIALVRVPRSEIRVYQRSQLVSWVEPNWRFRIAEAPNDPLLQYQWSLTTMDVLDAWETETGVTAPVIVGVADTGVDLGHPDLAGRLLGGMDFVNNDQDPTDDHGHGTHVSGVIAANPDNGIGVAGMSWGADILPIKVCGEEGGCDNFAITAGIAFAVEQGADVLNLSLGGPSPSCPRSLAAAAALANARGTLLVAAAGNSAQVGNPVSYPAACEGFLSVGATDIFDDWAQFSNSGKWVDVSAPGVSIMSTLPQDSSDKRWPGYGQASGTSMAAPHVAGLAALLFSQNPDWTADQVAAQIEATARDLGPKGRDKWFGAGRIDVRKALR